MCVAMHIQVCEVVCFHTIVMCVVLLFHPTCHLYGCMWTGAASLPCARSDGRASTALHFDSGAGKLVSVIVIVYHVF